MIKTETLNKNLIEVKTKIYDQCALEISKVNNEQEGIEYDACQFELNGMKIIGRSSKITPKKVGQFVTCWKRNLQGITEPFSALDQIDFFVINAQFHNRFGQFVFPKSELIYHGILTSDKKEGKRGFRVYPTWDNAPNKQALKTQKWQQNYFYEISETSDLKRVKELYNVNI